MEAKRGYLPEDDRNFSPEALKTLKRASRHVCYLIGEGYDLKQAFTFVGNHFLLSERQRLAIARSVATPEQLHSRAVREKTDLTGAEVWVDGFNAIISLEVLFAGSLLFRGMDGTVRDLAALRGTYRLIPETDTAVRLLLDTLAEKGIASAHILLDEPMSNSGRLKARIAGLGEGSPFDLDIQLHRDVDRALWEKENVISSDSIILDHCRSWFNLLKRCTEKTGAHLLQVWE